MALRAKTWKKALNTTSDLNNNWILEMRYQIGLGKTTWYYDQWITTYGILKNHICTVPSYSGLWNKGDLEFDPDFDDSEQCWHGSGYKGG